MKKQHVQVLVCILIAVMSVTMLSGCGAKKEKEEKAAKKPKTSTNEVLCKQYLDVLEHLEDYDFGDDVTSSGDFNWTFSIVQMKKGEAPALLVSRMAKTWYVSSDRIFQYDLKAKKMIAPDNEILSEGVAPAGGFRGGLSEAEDGNGLSYFTTESGNGDSEIQRVTIEGEELKLETVWSGSIMDVPESKNKEIVWYDRSEKDSLMDILDGKKTKSDVLKDEADASTDSSASGGTDSSADSSTSNTDNSDIQTFKGTIRTLNHDEILQLPNQKPLTGYEDVVATVLLFDQRQDVIGHATEMPRWKVAADMIVFDNPEKVKAYEGKHVTVQFRTDKLWWPSYASLPLNAAHADDCESVK